jgi:CheY-like chemotaxis protein
VAEAADGRAGLAELERLSPDALLVDYAMPGISGAEVARAARQHRPDLPVVLATGYASNAPLGGLPTLRKPFRIDDLAEVLGRALARSGAASTPAS